MEDRDRKIASVKRINISSIKIVLKQYCIAQQLKNRENYDAK